MSFLSLHDLSPSEQSLLARAKDAMHFAYSPYSNFCVGAAVEAMDGSIYVGTNLENGAYAGVMHAEMVALAVANNAGVRKLKTIAVIGCPRDGFSEEPVMSCGMCRQYLYEFAQLGSDDMIVIGSNTRQDKILRLSLSELFPRAFGSKDVGVDISRFQ